MKNAPNKVQSSDAELPDDTVLNPGMIMMRDDALNPFDLPEESNPHNKDS
ncbi:hypothetical protein PU629_04315 [Pullulanibacillus sp. KACC 23026]|nr:hypothetical protein [Pullulanibacillus sp. KACC 23026]WEG13600.1 hypothetical protein PU629_04315 [Pullulanibacillus sp. KACC 23026]